MDEFLPGCLLFVGESEPEGAVERGAFDSVRGGEEADEAAGLGEHAANVRLGESGCSIGRALPAVDDGLCGGDVGLNFACLARGEDRVHASTDGGEEPVELGAKPLVLTASARDLGRFTVGGVVSV